MSQQPPYGAPEPQQPYSPYGPYGYPQQQQRSNATRNILLGVGLAILLFCGGLFAFAWWAIAQADFDDFDSYGEDYAGSQNDPLTVVEGDAFEIRGFEYEDGWSIASTAGVTGLRATNQRDDEDSETATLRFSLIRDNEVLAEISCVTTATIRFERSVTLDCSNYGAEVPAGPYDEIEVYDTSYSE